MLLKWFLDNLRPKRSKAPASAAGMEIENPRCPVETYQDLSVADAAGLAVAMEITECLIP